VSRHQLLSRTSLRIWLVAHAVVLVSLSAWVLTVAFDTSVPTTTPLPSPSPSTRVPSLAPLPPNTDVFTVEDILQVEGQHFGISSPNAPWSVSEHEAIAEAAGFRPTLIEFFMNWTDEFRPEAIAASYQLGGIPVVSWEPWAGESYGVDQPVYSLANIAAGAHDEYIRRFATAVRDYGWPIVLRFAHEMNGNWYAWSERRSGNNAGDFVPAWRHVHDIFTEVGADNVVWVWSPNIIRAVPNVALAPLYPGDDYVDWVGVVGYATGEATAAQVFEPTLERIREFTDLPLLITETGAEPGENQVEWIRDFFRWLPTRSDIVGFIWFEYDKSYATADWRFTATPQTLAAFQEGIATIELAPPPEF